MTRAATGFCCTFLNLRVDPSARPPITTDPSACTPNGTQVVLGGAVEVDRGESAQPLRPEIRHSPFGELLHVAERYNLKFT